MILIALLYREWQGELYQPTVSTSRIQAAASAAINQRAVETAVRAKAPVHQEDVLRYAMPTINGHSILSLNAAASITFSSHAIEQMQGGRGDVGMSEWSVQYILENGVTSPSTSVAGRYITTLSNFGKVVTEGDRVITVIPYGSEAGPELQGWFIEVLIAALAAE